MRKFFVAFSAGFLMILLNMGVSMLFNSLSPLLKAEYQNSVVFRKMSDPLMTFFWIVPFVTAGILLWIWNLSKGLFEPESFVHRGFKFAKLYWLVTIPGMLISYSSFEVSGLMVIQWTIGNLVQALCAGLMYARFLP